eukprot:103363-Prymnesium_polylepis.2
MARSANGAHSAHGAASRGAERAARWDGGLLDCPLGRLPRTGAHWDGWSSVLAARVPSRGFGCVAAAQTALVAVRAWGASQWRAAWSEKCSRLRPATLTRALALCARRQLAHGVEEMFTALGVGSLTDLLDAYKMTASKVLSLWQKQAEQEADVERLEHEIRALQASRIRTGPPHTY